MPFVRHTCHCGHSWELPSDATVPQAALRCPACGTDQDSTVTHLPGTVKSAEPPPVPRPEIPGFDLLEEVNRGGMGVVYKARQIGLNRIVALKFIIPDRVGSQDMLKRFKREVQAAALLSHANIVGVYHTDLDAAMPYLVMEYVDGIDLHRLVSRAGPLPIHEACFYIKEAAAGLQHAAELGLVHRDIKPANLMVTPSPLNTASSGVRRTPRVKILDMGLARVQTDGDSPSEIMTQAGEFLGTPDFIAPEQAEDPRNADARSDLYSLGGSLYYLLTGQVPFPGTNIVQKLRRQLTDPPPSPLAKRADVPATLDAVVRKLMARDPAERHQSPGELIDDLDRISRAASSLPALPSVSTLASTPQIPSPTAVRPPSGTLSGPPASGTLALPNRGLPAAPTASLSAAQTQAVTLPAAVGAHDGGVTSLSAGPGLLVTAGADGSIKVWNPDRLRDVRPLTNGVGAVQQVAVVLGTRTAVSCAIWPDGTDVGVQVWDVDAEVELLRLRGPVEAIQSVAVSPDGRKVAAGTPDGSVLVWPLAADGSPPVVSKGHHGAVTALVFLPNSEDLLSTSVDGRVRHWDLRTGQSKGASNANIGPLAAIAFGAKNRMAVGGDSIAARKRDGGYARFDGHDGRVLSLCYSPDGKLLFSGGADCTIRVWKADDGIPIATLTGHSGPVTGLAPTAGGLALFSVSLDGGLRRWRVPTAPGA